MQDMPSVLCGCGDALKTHSDVQTSVSSSEIIQTFESGCPSPTRDDGDRTTCTEQRECGAA